MVILQAAKLLSASSIEEAEEISTAVVGTLQALEEMSKLQIQQEVAPQSTGTHLFLSFVLTMSCHILVSKNSFCLIVRVKPPRPKGPPPSVQAKPAARLSSYDVNKVYRIFLPLKVFVETHLYCVLTFIDCYNR